MSGLKDVAAAPRTAWLDDLVSSWVTIGPKQAYKRNPRVARIVEVKDSEKC